MRAALLLVLAASLSGCAALGGGRDEAPSTAKRDELDKIHDLEEKLARGGDDVALRCQLAHQWLTMVKWPNASKGERLEYAKKALSHADKAVELGEDRVEAHYFRALAIGRVLESSSIPDMSQVEPLEAEGVRARELDPAFDDAGPLRFLAVLYAEAPAWPLGPESAQDDEVIVELFAEALRLAPLAPENHLAYAEYLADEDQEGKAREALRRARELLEKDRKLKPVDRRELEDRIRALTNKLGGQSKLHVRPAPSPPAR